MSDPTLQFHHLGLALRAQVRAVRFLEHLGYRLGETVFDPEQNVHVRMATSDSQPDVELITPGEGDGPLTPFLNDFSSLIYHVCYEVQDREAALAALAASGSRLLEVSPPKPAILFGGRRVSFHQVVGFGLIELLEPLAGTVGT